MSLVLGHNRFYTVRLEESTMMSRAPAVVGGRLTRRPQVGFDVRAYVLTFGLFLGPEMLLNFSLPPPNDAGVHHRLYINVQHNIYDQQLKPVC
ncbi:unnamed protein product [Ectocarpus sp. 6 AP-2014]